MRTFQGAYCAAYRRPWPRRVATVTVSRSPGLPAAAAGAEGPRAGPDGSSPLDATRSSPYVFGEKRPAQHGPTYRTIGPSPGPCGPLAPLPAQCHRKRDPFGAERARNREHIRKPENRAGHCGRGRFGQRRGGRAVGRGGGRASRAAAAHRARGRYGQQGRVCLGRVHSAGATARPGAPERDGRPVRRTLPGLLVTTELSHREPAETLHTVAGNHGTIVVGSRGLGGFGSLTHGSVGVGTAAGANGPVVVVRGVEDADSTGTVLVGVRDEEDLDVVRHAAQSAQLRKASLRLLNIWNMFQHVGVVATMLDDVGEIAQERKDKISAVAAGIRDNFPEPR